MGAKDARPVDGRSQSTMAPRMRREWHREREGCLKRKEEEGRKGSKPRKMQQKTALEEGF